MSSKFSSAAPIQKPPHVCIKPPAGPDYVPPALPAQPLQGYVEYFTPYTPAEGGMISLIALHPSGPANKWSGSATAGYFRLELEMTCNPGHTRLAFQLDFFSGGMLVDTIVMTDLPARSWTPFDSGQVTPPNQPEHGRIGFHVWF